MIRRQVGVDHGGLDVRVTHQLHDGGEINTLHDKVAGECVAKGVDSCQVLDTGTFGDLDQLLPDFRFEFATITVTEDVVALEDLIVLLFHGSQQIMERIANWYLSFTSLRLPIGFTTYPDLASLEVNIIPFQVLKFSFAHTGVQESEVNRV